VGMLSYKGKHCCEFWYCRFGIEICLDL